MQRISNVRTVVRTTVLGLLALAIAMPIWAQDNDPSDFGIDEIVVTATKVEQSIRDVPIAINAFQADELDNRGVEDLSDLQRVTPSLIIGSSNSNTNGGVIRIRGLGTSGNNIGLESAVGVFIDGVFRSRAGLALQDFVDLERVEVLKGPQGTLFGKNTSAGAVTIYSKKPSFETGGQVAFTVGNRGERKAQASFNTPLIDDVLAFRIGGSWHERDGEFEQSNGSDDYNDRDRWTLRGQLLWTPTEDLDFRLIADYTEHTEKCCVAGYASQNFDNTTALAAAGLSSGNAIAALAPPGDGSIVGESWRRFTAGSNYDPAEDFDDWGVSLETNWDLDFATVTSIISYREFEVFRAQDIDFSPVDILQPGNTDELWETFSFELRATGQYEDIMEGLTWLVGMYYSTEDVTNTNQVVFGDQGDDYVGALTGVPTFVFTNIINQRPAGTTGSYLGTGSQNGFEQETVTASVFTHNTLSITENLDFTLGARFTWEEKEATTTANGAPQVDPSQIVNVTTVPAGAITNDTQCLDNNGLLGPLIGLRVAFTSTCDNFSWNDKFDNTDWSFFSSLLYRITDEHNLFLTFSHGFKSGGWNANVNSLQFLPDGNQAMPAATSTATLNTPAPIVGEITDGRQFDPEFTNNFELGLKSRMMDGRLSLNTTIFHTTFKNYQLQTFTGLFFFINNVPRVKARGIEIDGFYAVNEYLGLQFAVTYSDTRYGNNLFITPAPTFKLDGQRINSAPAWSGSIGFNLEYPIGETGWLAFANASFQYRGRTNTASDLDPSADVRDFHRTNAQTGVRSEDGTWEIKLWVENIEDHASQGVFDAVFQAGGYSAFAGGREYFGLTVKYAFGDD